MPEWSTIHCHLFNDVMTWTTFNTADCILILHLPTNAQEAYQHSLRMLKAWWAIRGTTVFKATPCLLLGQHKIADAFPLGNWFTIVDEYSSLNQLRFQMLNCITNWPTKVKSIPSGPCSKLTYRQQEIISLTLAGLSLLQIAKRLKLSVKTVWEHQHKGIIRLGGKKLYDLVGIHEMES